jgi:hypothetical protein
VQWVALPIYRSRWCHCMQYCNRVTNKFNCRCVAVALSQRWFYCTALQCSGSMNGP